MKRIEITVTDREEIKLLVPCLLAARIRTILRMGNGTGPRLVILMDAVGDEAMLRLWELLSDLRVRYIEAKQAEIAEQTSFLEGADVDAAH